MASEIQFYVDRDDREVVWTVENSSPPPEGTLLVVRRGGEQTEYKTGAPDWVLYPMTTRGSKLQVNVPLYPIDDEPFLKESDHEETATNPTW